MRWDRHSYAQNDIYGKYELKKEEKNKQKLDPDEYNLYISRWIHKAAGRIVPKQMWSNFGSYWHKSTWMKK